MRKTTVVYFISLFALLGGASPALADQSPWEAQASKLPFKSAIIHYTVEGSEKGEETYYARDRGMESVRARKTTGKSFFQTVNVDTITITTRDFVVNVDNAKKTGEKFINPVKFMIEEYNKLSSAEKETVRKNALTMGTNMMGSLTGSGLMRMDKNADTLLGYKCDIMSGLGMKIWSIADTGINLKTEISLIGSTTTTATKVEANASIPASAFEVPAGVNVVYNKDMDRKNQEMAKSVINMLKDPQHAKNAENSRMEAGKEPEKDVKGSRSASGVTEPKIDDQQRKEADEAVKKSMEKLKGIFGGR